MNQLNERGIQEVTGVLNALKIHEGSQQRTDMYDDVLTVVRGVGCLAVGAQDRCKPCARLTVPICQALTAVRLELTERGEIE